MRRTQRSSIVMAMKPDEVGMAFGHTAVDVKRFRTVEVVGAEVIAARKLRGRGCLARADRPTNPEGV